MNYRIPIFCLALLSGALFPGSLCRAHENGPPERVYPAFWALKLPTLAGDTVALRSYRGKYLLLNFWGEWCATCVEELPFLVKLQAKYGKDRLRIVGFLKSYDRKRAETMIAKNGLSWPQLPLTEGVETGFAIRKFPTNLLISPSGEIVMDGFSHHFRDFKRRMGDGDSSQVGKEAIRVRPE